MQPQANQGIWDLLFFLLMTGSNLLGLPPGERDVNFLKAAPPQTLVYFEWSARGPGKLGLPGVDGFAADPEVTEFFQRLEVAMKKNDEVEDQDSPQEVRPVPPQLVNILAARPGCVFVAFDPIPPNKAGFEGLQKTLMGVRAGAIFNAGSETDLAWKLMISSLKSLPDFSYDEKSSTHPISLPFPGYQFVVHREGDRILFALGTGTLERMLAGLAGNVPGLESNPRFQKAIQRVEIPRIGAIGWIDFQETINTVTKVLGPLGGFVRPVLATVGADALDHVVQSSGVDRDTMIQRTFIATGGRTDGVMVLTAGQQIEPQHFIHIPADADLILATSISVKKVYQEARQLLTRAQLLPKVESLSLRVFDEAIKQLEAELELKIVDDVLPAFGDVVTAFDSPAAGGMIATSLVICLEIRDPAKARTVFERLLKLIEQSLSSDSEEEPDAPVVRSQPFLGHKIYYFSGLGSGYGVQHEMTSSLCLTDRHLLFAVHPQALKAQLRHLQSNRPGFDQLANRKVALPKGDVLTYAFLDGPRASSLMASVLPYLSPTLLNRLDTEGVSLDTCSIPSAAAILPYFAGDSTAVVVRQKDGLLLETRNAPPVVASIALLSIYRAWHSTDFELIDDPLANEGHIKHSRRRNGKGAEQAQLGPVENKVIPAVAQSKDRSNPAGMPKPSPYRKLAPIFIKALVPDGVQHLIPESAYRRLEEGPSEAVIQRREEARLRREEARRKREERRKIPQSAQ